VIEKLPPVSPEVKSLLQRERVIPSLPPAVRARALAAARSALASRPLPASPVHVPAPWIRWAAAAALTIVAGGAAAAVAYHRHVEHLRAITAPAPSSAPAPSGAIPAVALPPPAAESTPVAAPEEARRTKLVVPQEELRLLRLARAAVARDDFNAALRPIAEHARRFRDGRLAEEREALRVKALAGLGRTEEARRAASAFESRFPRSVLLPAVRRISPHGE